MPDGTALDIPYEGQLDPTSRRLCGAAALCMVYRAFGMDCAQVEIAQTVAMPGPAGNEAARTYLLAQDALARGLSALVLRAKDPLRTLRACRQHQLLAILNHRPRPESPNGHFTVLVKLTGDAVIVHDPLRGPNTRLSHNDLLALWRPLPNGSEITGRVLVVLAKDPPPAVPCPACGSTLPEAITCPGCRKLVALRPAAIVGCLTPSCPERTWETLFCPYCDTSLLPLAGRGTGGVAPADEDDPRKIKPFCEQLDKFLALVLTANKGRPFAGTESHFVQMRDLQAQMLALQKQEVAERQAKDAQPPLQPQQPPPSVAEPPPRPPVDWNELGRKLCTELFGTEAAATTDGAEAATPERLPTAKEIVDDMRRRRLIR